MRKSLRFGVAIAVLLCLLVPSLTHAQLAPEPFKNDPSHFFGGAAGKMWVGNVKFMAFDYSDTLFVGPNDEKPGLLVQRVLVDNDDTVLVSLGEGTVVPESKATSFHVAWHELGQGDATGTMRWDDDDEQWEVSFDGEWQQWSLNLRRSSDTSFTAALARSVAQFPPVELVAVTYTLVKEGKLPRGQGQ
jgi:hypothetical protein